MATPQPEMSVVRVTVPQGCAGGQTIQVRLEGGSVLEVVVPAGLDAGEVFEMAWAEDEPSHAEAAARLRQMDTGFGWATSPAEPQSHTLADIWEQLLAGHALSSADMHALHQQAAAELTADMQGRGALLYRPHKPAPPGTAENSFARGASREPVFVPKLAFVPSHVGLDNRIFLGLVLLLIRFQR